MARHDSDDDVLTALVEEHRASLLGYALGLTRGDQAAAEDIVKETFYRASHQVGRIAQRPASVRAWLVVTANNVFADQPQSAAVPRRSQPPAVLPLEGATTIVRAMDELSRVHREILVELFYRGTSLQEAAADRGVPVETVKTRLYYAMRALRVVLDQQAP